MNEIDLIADKYHEKMKDEIKFICPKCKQRLYYENLGDEDCNKPYLCCSNCNYMERQY